MSIKNLSLKILIFLLLFLLTMALAAQEPLRYDVAVSVKVVPIFAVDPKGNPVYDLAQEELEIYVNGRAVTIADFQRYTFQDSIEIDKQIKKKQSVTQPRGKTERVVFIILDSIYNSQYGWGRSKKIAEKLIRSSPPGDTVILLENTPAGGLKYHGSGQSHRDPLIKKMKKLKMPYEKWSRDIFQSRQFDQFTDFGLQDMSASSAGFLSQKRHILTSEQARYQNQIIQFSRSLAQLQHALNTITRPKIVFLISEGIAKGAFNLNQEEWNLTQQNRANSRLQAALTSSLLVPEETAADGAVPLSTRHFTYLMDVVKAINRGGSVLYTINPARVKHDDANRGDLSLMTLAGESGGRYFAGSDIDTVIKEVRQTTAAYYELAFPLGAVAADRMTIDIKCRRQGVRIHSLNHAEKENPYARMEPLKKKLFALDVVNGGNWSRIAGKVVRIKLPGAKTEKVGQKTFYSVTIPLPKKMQDRRLDIFSLSIQSDTQKVDIRLIDKPLKNAAQLRMTARPNQRLYFVIVEPKNTYCIYNRVI